MTPESAVFVSNWIDALRAATEGDRRERDVAAQEIWDRYFKRLVRRLAGRVRSSGDGEAEDVALSVMDSFYRGAAAGRFPQLDDPNYLWPLLVVMGLRKAADRLAVRSNLKGGGGRTIEGAEALAQVVGRGPSPELAAEVAEQVHLRLAALGNDEELGLRRIALWKLEGLTSAEIAKRLGCCERTVAARLGLVRRRWAKL